MLKLGEKQTLVVERQVRMGVYLKEKEAKDGEHVLLPGSQVPSGIGVGDALEVFLYKDSEDRLIATRKEPGLVLHEVGYLTVRETSRIGAFLDWGLDKDLLLPFREQTRGAHVQKGQRILCAVYIDKSGRLAATMNVYPYLETDSPYHTGDEVTGTVYETSGNWGIFVAVDDRYSALIPKKELVRELTVGEKIQARVTKVHPNGKLDLSLRGRSWEMIGGDADRILARMETEGGRLPFTDKAEPALIQSEMQMSKAQFKRAVGHLLKEGRIEIREKEIVLLQGSD